MRWRHFIRVSPRYPATQLDKARALYPSDEATFSRQRVLLQSQTVMTAAAAAEQESGGITEGAKPTIVIPIKGGGEKACQCHCKDKRLGARPRNLFLERCTKHLFLCTYHCSLASSSSRSPSSAACQRRVLVFSRVSKTPPDSK